MHSIKLVYLSILQLQSKSLQGRRGASEEDRLDKGENRDKSKADFLCGFYAIIKINYFSMQSL